MKRIFILVLLVLPLQIFSQQYIDKTVAEAKVALKKNDPQVTITKESAKEITYTIKGKKNLTATGTLVFGDTGKCISEKILASCDTCINPFLEPLLSQKQYHWNKINENQYVSDFDSKLMVELPPDGRLNYYKLMRMEWSRELYDLLLKN